MHVDSQILSLILILFGILQLILLKEIHFLSVLMLYIVQDSVLIQTANLPFFNPDHLLNKYLHKNHLF